MATRSKPPHPPIDLDNDDDDTRRARESYAWESSKVRSWEQIEEDPTTGRLKSYSKDTQIARKKTRDDGLTGVRRGIIRFVVLIIDMSAALIATDLKPSRAELIVDAVLAFVKEFFDQNPISQLCVVVTRDGAAVRLSSFSSNVKLHVEAIQKALRNGPKGVASLQNALLIANKSLQIVPPYGLREIIVCFGSLTTCDPGDIHASIAELEREKVRCSAVGVAAELYVLHALTSKTNGSYFVAMNEDHFRECLSAHVLPPPTTTKQVSASLIRMGFPILLRQKAPALFVNNPNLKGRFGYNCPRCSSWLSEVPSECTLCGLTLVSSPHLARSYHHLFPVPKFTPLDTYEAPQTTPLHPHSQSAIENVAEKLINCPMLRCTGCKKLLPKNDSIRLLCPRCLNTFCIDCDSFIHDSLHHCPGCGTHSSANP